MEGSRNQRGRADLKVKLSDQLLLMLLEKFIILTRACLYAIQLASPVTWVHVVLYLKLL